MQGCILPQRECVDLKSQLMKNTALIFVQMEDLYLH